jgi:2OG-Fe(II) oxygenase superfamily
MSEIRVVPWSVRAELRSLSSVELVLVVEDGHDVWIADPERVGALYDGVLAAHDGTIVGGLAGEVANLAVDLPDEEMAAALVGAWSDGADLDLDHDLEVFAATEWIRLRGTALIADAYFAGIVHGRAPEIADLRASLAANRRAVDDLAAAFAIIPPQLEQVAPEVLVTSMVTPKWCEELCALIEAFDAWESDPDDPVPGDEFSLRLTPRLFDVIERGVADHIVPALRTYWTDFAWNGLTDAFVIRYDAMQDTPELRVHHDVAQISMAIRLNDGYQGGALRFPRQDWDNLAVPVGSAAIWPSLVTHPHAGERVTAGRKYSLTIWFALPS